MKKIFAIIFCLAVFGCGIHRDSEDYFLDDAEADVYPVPDTDEQNEEIRIEEEDSADDAEDFD